MPFASFCISTYKRPQFLKTQIELLLRQVWQDFEIVISDNDPSGESGYVVSQFADHRIRYFNNGANLGMIESFNKSVERASGDFVVMVTDDDPVDPALLADMYQLTTSRPQYGLYGGFIRKHLVPEAVEIIGKEHFIAEILDPAKTPWFLWSSCVMKRNLVLQVNKIPDYGSPHLADHALIAMVGSLEGAVIINKKYSSLSSHDTNFSKFNFAYYVNGCRGFFDVMKRFCETQAVAANSMEVVSKHLHTWFFGCIFNLKRYYTLKKDPNTVREVDSTAEAIIAFSFMKPVVMKYRLKSVIFEIKKKFHILGP